MKQWEIIADTLSKAGATSQRWIVRIARSSLLTHIAATESVSLCVPMKS